MTDDYEKTVEGHLRDLALVEQAQQLGGQIGKDLGDISDWLSSLQFDINHSNCTGETKETLDTLLEEIQDQILVVRGLWIMRPRTASAA